MVKRIVTIEDVVNLLNSAVAADINVMHALVEHRVPCNDVMKEHPTIQVVTDPQPCVGVLGLINGMFGADDETGTGGIYATYDDYNRLIGFGLNKKVLDKSCSAEQKV